MKFFIRKRHQPPAVIIVALIDVLIVVLIFLMVTTTFKKPQPPALRLALPDSTHTTKPGASDSPPFMVYIEENGVLRFGPDAKPATVESIKAALLAEAAKNPNIKLALSADKKAPFGQIVRIMDAAKEANVKTISAFAKTAAPN